jgi:hypothetical protein
LTEIFDQTFREPENQSHALQEDCVQILVRLVGDENSIMRLAKVKSTSKAFGNVLQTGTSKAISNILWLTWRMTLDAAFCKSIAKNNEMVSAFKSFCATCSQFFLC